MRVLAIGDIHGCLVSLETLLGAVAPETRGPDRHARRLCRPRAGGSREVIEKLIALQATGRLIAILGNHDQMMLDAREDPAKLEEWASGYGKRTLAVVRERRRAGLALTPTLTPNAPPLGATGLHAPLGVLRRSRASLLGGRSWSADTPPRRGGRPVKPRTRDLHRHVRPRWRVAHVPRNQEAAVCGKPTRRA